MLSSEGEVIKKKRSQFDVRMKKGRKEIRPKSVSVSLCLLGILSEVKPIDPRLTIPFYSIWARKFLN